MSSKLEPSAKVRDVVIAIRFHALGGLFYDFRRFGSRLCDPVVSFLSRISENDDLFTRVSHECRINATARMEN